MSRSARLLELIQALRRRRTPVSAQSLADELGASKRTIYRDIATLIAQGAPIAGAAGVGYVLRAEFLPPLAFDDEELDAIILGLQLVGRRGDTGLARAAANALGKVIAVLPAGDEGRAANTGLIAVTRPTHAKRHLLAIRRAMRGEFKARLVYMGGDGASSERVVWPIAVGFFDETEMLAAWCEVRKDFRHFRLDRIVEVEVSAERYPARRPVLLAHWRRARPYRPAQSADTN